MNGLGVTLKGLEKRPPVKGLQSRHGEQPNCLRNPFLSPRHFNTGYREIKYLIERMDYGRLLPYHV